MISTIIIILVIGICTIFLINSINIIGDKIIRNQKKIYDLLEEIEDWRGYKK